MATDSLHTTFGVIEESSYGTTPSAAIQKMNLSQVPELSRPRNIGRPDVVTGPQKPRPYPSRVLQEDGQLSCQSAIQFGNMRLFWEAALFNDQAADVSVSASTIAATASTGVITDSGNGLGDIEVGDMIYVAGAGWTGAGNSAAWLGPVSAAAAGSITVPSGQVANDVSTGSVVTIDTRRLVDGSTARSFSVEWQADELTTDFRSGVGFKVQNHTWRWNQGGFAEEQCSLIGKAPSHGTSTIGTGGPTAAPTTDFLNCIQDYGTIYISEAATSYVVTSLELSLDVELQPFYGLGSVGPSGIVEARILPTVNLSMIYDDNAKALLDNIESFDTISMFWDAVDLQGNRVCWHIPALKAVTGDPGGGAPNSFWEFRNLSFEGHDPAKDQSSSYVSSGFDYMVGIYESAA